MATEDQHVYSLAQENFPKIVGQENATGINDNCESEQKPVIIEERPGPGEYIDSADINYNQIEYEETREIESPKSGTEQKEETSNEIDNTNNHTTAEDKANKTSNNHTTAEDKANKTSNNHTTAEDKAKKTSNNLPEENLNMAKNPVAHFYSLLPCGTLPVHPWHIKPNLADNNPAYDRKPSLPESKSNLEEYAGAASEYTENEYGYKVYKNIDYSKTFTYDKGITLGEREPSVYESCAKPESTNKLPGKIKPILKMPSVANIIIFLILVILCIVFGVLVAGLKRDLDEVKLENAWLRGRSNEMETQLTGNYPGSLVIQVQVLNSRVDEIQDYNISDRLLSIEQQSRYQDRTIYNLRNQIQALEEVNLKIKNDKLLNRIETLESLNIPLRLLSLEHNVTTFALEIDDLKKFVSFSDEKMKNAALHNRTEELKDGTV